MITMNLIRHSHTVSLIKFISEMDLPKREKSAMLGKVIDEIWRDGYEFAKETVNEWYQPKPW